MNQNLVEVVNGIPVVSSRDVAEKFDKQHSEIIKRIKGYERTNKSSVVEHIDGILDQFSSSVNTLQFIIPSTYVDSSGKENIEFLLTRDGFSIVVMGFTGAKALQWKVQYINAFNKMESHIAQMSSKGNLLLSIYNGGQKAVVAAKELTKLEVEQATTPLLETIEDQRPAVEFTRHVTEVSDAVDMGEFAKIIKKGH